jgi:hypothetical protein
MGNVTEYIQVEVPVVLRISVRADDAAQAEFMAARFALRVKGADAKSGFDYGVVSLIAPRVKSVHSGKGGG